MLTQLKIVPVKKPNSCGTWVLSDVPDGMSPFDYVAMPGFFTVAYRPFPEQSTSLQDGGPMHAVFLSGGHNG